MAHRRCGCSRGPGATCATCATCAGAPGGSRGRSGTWHRDALHGRSATHSFHPVLILPLSDDEVRARLRAFAHSYRGAWRWAWTPYGRSDTCRTFQDALLAAAGLREELEHLPSRGSGCPFLYPPRTLWWGLQDRVSSAVRRSA